LHDDRKPCREENAHDGNLENARRARKNKGRNTGILVLKNDFCFAFWLYEIYHEEKYKGQPYRFKRFDLHGKQNVPEKIQKLKKKKNILFTYKRLENY